MTRTTGVGAPPANRIRHLGRFLELCLAEVNVAERSIVLNDVLALLDVLQELFGGPMRLSQLLRI